MRDIKFDAIYTPTGEHFVPFEIDFVNKSLTYDITSEGKKWCYFSLDGEYGDAILREFTGLKDKCGNEIYEGDIVKRFNDTPFSMEDGSLRYDTWKVEFKYSRWSFINTPGSPSSSWPSFSSNAEYMEVIGNIHDNPELLIDAI